MRREGMDLIPEAPLDLEVLEHLGIGLHTDDGPVKATLTAEQLERYDAFEHEVSESPAPKSPKKKESTA